MKNKWKMPGCYIQERVKGGVEKFQGSYYKFGVRLSCDTHATRELAQNYLIECVDRYKNLKTKNAAAKFMEEAANLDATPASELVPVLTEYKLSEEVLSEACEKFLESKKATQDDKYTMPIVLKLIKEVKIGGLKPSFAVSYIEQARLTMTKYKRPYSLESIWIQLTTINKVVKWRAQMMDCPAQAFHVRDEYFLDQARSEGRDVRNGWRNTRTRRLDPGEEELIMAALAALGEPCPRHWQLIFQLALATGSRQVELAQARWSEFSPGGKTWTIPHNKTKERRHTLSAEAKAVLAELRELASPGSDKLFHTIRDQGKVCKTFRKVIDGLGLVNLRFHDFRHEGITRIVADSAEDIVVIMRWVGHSSEKMNERYTHLREDEIERRESRRAAKRLAAESVADGVGNVASPGLPSFASSWAYGQAPSIGWSGTTLFLTSRFPSRTIRLS